MADAWKRKLEIKIDFAAEYVRCVIAHNELVAHIRAAGLTWKFIDLSNGRRNWEETQNQSFGRN